MKLKSPDKGTVSTIPTDVSSVKLGFKVLKCKNKKHIQASVKLQSQRAYSCASGANATTVSLQMSRSM